MPRLVPVALLAAALLLAATGCAPEPKPSATTPPASSPSATPTPDPIVAPEPLLDLDCGDFPSASEISGYLGADVALADGVGVDGYGNQYFRPLEIQQLGGLVCTWDDGVAADPDDGHDTSPFSLVATLLPGGDAGAKWKRYSDAYDGSTDFYCYNYEPGDAFSYCGYSQLVAGAWLELTISAGRHDDITSDAELEAATLPLADGFRAAVEGAAPGAPPWSPPEGTSPLSDDCAAYVSGGFVADAVGASAAIDTFVYRDGPQIDQTLDLDGEHYLVLRCAWAYDGADAGPGGLDAWPGGEWAWREITGSSPGQEAEGGAVASEDIQRLSLAGLAPGDQAWLGCDEETGICNLDLIVDHNWIRLNLADPGPRNETPGLSFSADKRTALRAIAAEVLTNLAAR